MQYNIIMVGPQGSGKGTQAQMLSEKLGVPHISTGDIFREMRLQDSDLGRKVRELIDHGNLVPDDVTNQVVAERLKKQDVRHGYILDGYPRNQVQAEFLDKIRPVNYCILIDVADSESMKRISARRICSECRKGYNTISIKPKKSGVCDACGGVLVMRDDDKPEYVKKRLAKYHAETKPIIGYYEKRGVLFHINGEQEIAKVYQDMIAKLKIK